MPRNIKTAVVLAVVLALGTAQSTFAIVFGQVDDSGTYANVGALFGTYPDDSDPDTNEGPHLFCSGTLISPTVFLTAAHCFQGDPEGTVYSVSFDSPADPSTAATGTAVGHPLAGSLGTNEPFDIGVLLLDETQTIEPAPLPHLNQLGQMGRAALRATRFTTVGFGSVRDDKTRAWQSIDAENEERLFARQSALTLTKSWLVLSMNPSTGDGGTCNGDSGGPHFLPDGTVASITVSGDFWCRATDWTYRIDTKVARDFLAPFLAD